jgi:hypothetical protein
MQQAEQAVDESDFSLVSCILARLVLVNIDLMPKLVQSM